MYKDNVISSFYFIIIIILTNFTWILTEKRKELLESVESIPEFGKRSKSQLIEMAMDEFVLKHGKSNNPQTQITLFKDNMVNAIPSIYETDATMWNKFYSKINKKDYDELDNLLMWILARHNKEGKRFR